MPFFEARDKKQKVYPDEVDPDGVDPDKVDPDEVDPDEYVIQRPVNRNSHVENFDQNFLDDFISTLDDDSKYQVNMVLSVCPNHNPKKIYDMIRQNNGDCDPVIDKLLEIDSKE